MSVVPTNIDSFISQFLMGPVEEFLSRPKKDLRSEMVKIGFLLYAPEDPNAKIQHDLNILSSMLEWIHDGSLIVDDIQDNSQERRGEQCLHLIYGVPCAINAANWMYFEALKKLSEISVDESRKLKMFQMTLDTMSLAHQGQAIDLMSSVHKISREDIFHLGMKAHDLKSGAIFSLALNLGALLASEKVDFEYLSELGKRMGSSLQRFDDLGNLTLNNSSPKSLEDLRLGRPTWPWMYVSKYRSEHDYIRFQKAVTCLPDLGELEKFLAETNIRNEALFMAKSLHERIYDFLQHPFPGVYHQDAILQIRNILQKVAYAYV